MTELAWVIESILKRSENPQTIKDVLLEVRSELDDFSFCIIPVATEVFDLMKAGKVKMLSKRRFKWVKQ